MRTTNWTIALAMLASALMLAGCADQSDMQQLNQNEFTLRGMIAQDRQQIDALKAQLARQNDQIVELQHGAGSAGGQSSGMNDRVASLEAEVKALQAGMAATPGATPPGAGTPPPGAPAESVGGVPAATAGGPVAPAVPAEIPPTWPNELDDEINAAKSSSEPGVKIYREGLDAMKAGKYPLAVTKFTKLQHAYPKSPLSEPAEYFAANALFETGGYDQSILQFNDLVMRFPKGKYACAALLREGQAFVKLNDRIDA
ncbi:MAG TPA: outer membrane protein assembly factor BamD, partial [Patescibacteria group bacterium]|nr:outer membrane protein assembly factor BamD [Patescibacteria group bacterium]